jgi:hypothetical protein
VHVACLGRSDGKHVRNEQGAWFWGFSFASEGGRRVGIRELVDKIDQKMGIIVIAGLKVRKLVHCIIQKFEF